MKKKFSSMTMALLLLLSSLAIIGCTSDKVQPVGTTPAPTSLAPRGQLQGVVVEACTLKAIQGAEVSVAYDGAVHTVVTDKNGQYVFTGVPATDDDATGSSGTPTGTYRITISLVNQNAAIAAASGTPYPDYVYLNSDVKFTNLNDGTATTTGTESGSGANTPVDGISDSDRVEIGKLDGTITGSVTEEGGLAVSGAKVTLVFDSAASNRSASIPSSVSVTTDSAGKYTFTPLPSAGDVFDIYIEKSGYAQANVQNVAPICNTVVTMAGNTQIAKAAAAADNKKPYIIGGSYKYMSDIASTTTQLKFVYNESLADIFTNLQGGTSLVIEGFKFKPGQVFSTVTLTTTNVANDTVVVQPSALVGGYKYAIDLSKIQDLALNNMDPLLSKYTDTNSIYRFTVAAGTGKLAAITDLVQKNLNPVTDAAKGNATITYGNSNLPKGAGDASAKNAQSDFDGTLISLSWSPVTNAMAYRVYGSWCNGPYQLVYDGARSSCPACTMVETSVASFDSSTTPLPDPRMVEDVINNTGNGSSAADAPTTGTMDDLGQRMRFYVVSVNGDGLESDKSNIVAVKDNVRPIIKTMVLNVPDSSTSGAGQLTINFSEPMDYASVSNAANYSWLNGTNPTTGAATSPETTQVITVVSVAKNASNMENAEVVLGLSKGLSIDTYDTINSVATDMSGTTAYPTDTTSSGRVSGKDYIADNVKPRLVGATFSGTGTNGYFDVTQGTDDFTSAGGGAAVTINDTVQLIYSEELNWGTVGDNAYHAVTAGITMTINGQTANFFKASGSMVTFYFTTANVPIIALNTAATTVTPTITNTDMSANAINTAYDSLQYSRAALAGSDVVIKYEANGAF